ncbi:MAG: hypothetical protein Q8P42_11630 [Gallionella sp.]|nr:hypothetical protein [Gallionella sp.]
MHRREAKRITGAAATLKLADMSTGDVIRQYPTEEMLAESKGVRPKQRGQTHFS